MMIALGILIALGLAVIIMMFREQKAPVVNVETPNIKVPEYKDPTELIEKILKEIHKKGTDAEPVPGDSGGLGEDPESKPEPPATPPIDVKPIDHAKQMPHPKDDNLEGLSSRLVELYFSNHEPGQKYAIEEEQHNILLRIKAKLRYLQQDRLKDDPIEEPKAKARRSVPRPIM